MRALKKSLLIIGFIFLLFSCMEGDDDDDDQSLSERCESCYVNVFTYCYGPDSGFLDYDNIHYNCYGDPERASRILQCIDIYWPQIQNETGNESPSLCAQMGACFDD